MTTFRLKSMQFRREREDAWRELERIVERAERGGLLKVSADDLTQLPSLYRAAVSSLSVARAISLDRNLLVYLESLVARAYVVVYGNKRRAGEVLRAFVMRRFPSLVRRFWREVGLSALLMLAGTLAGLLLTMTDPGRFSSFIDPSMSQGRTPAASTEELREALYSKHGFADGLEVFAAFLFTHNAQIGLWAAALGFLAGAPVVYLMFTNGLMLGALAALYHERGLSLEFWAWVLPHGVPELGAICLCGAAGLVLARAVVFPGAAPRLENLARHGREAALIVIGAVGMLLIAAFIEGFFRQLVHDVTARYAVAVLGALAWSAYFLFAGRRR